MRVYPHFGFDFAMPTTSSVISTITRGCPGCFRRSAFVPLPRNEPSVPGEEGVGSDDTGDFRQEFAAEGLALCREPSSLGVGEAQSSSTEPSSEDFVLLEQVGDSGLLVTVDPTGDGDRKECPGLNRDTHDGGF